MQKAIAKAAEREREIPLGAQEMAKHISKKKKGERKSAHEIWRRHKAFNLCPNCPSYIPCNERGPVSVEIFSVPDHTARFRAQCPQVII